MKTDLVIEKCRILGVLDDGVASLGAAALQHLRQAQLVIGAARTLALFAAHMAPGAQQRDLTGALSQVPEWIRAAQADAVRVVVLATGDPLCHGSAAYLASRLCGHRLSRPVFRSRKREPFLCCTGVGFQKWHGPEFLRDQKLPHQQNSQVLRSLACLPLDFLRATMSICG